MDRYGDLIDGCPLVWTIPPDGIIAFDPIDQIVTGVSEGGPVTISAECGRVSGFSVIQVEGHIIEGLWLDTATVTSGNCGSGSEDFDITLEGDTIYLGGCRGTLTDHSYSCFHPGVLYSATGTFAGDWKSYTGTSAAYDGNGNVVCTWSTVGSKVEP